MPSISLATVYNCLEALVQSGLVKQVNLDRAPTRYCANLLEHSHFFCEQCGSVFDVDVAPTAGLNLGPGFVVSHAEVALRGLCPRCSEKTGPKASSHVGKTATAAENTNRPDLAAPSADLSDDASTVASAKEEALAMSERQTPNTL